MTALLPEIENVMVMAAEALAIVVTIATLVSSVTPTRADDLLLDRALHLINLLAGNVGHNRNADDQ